MPQFGALLTNDPDPDLTYPSIYDRSARNSFNALCPAVVLRSPNILPNKNLRKKLLNNNKNVLVLQLRHETCIKFPFTRRLTPAFPVPLWLLWLDNESYRKEPRNRRVSAVSLRDKEWENVEWPTATVYRWPTNRVNVKCCSPANVMKAISLMTNRTNGNLTELCCHLANVMLL